MQFRLVFEGRLRSRQSLKVADIHVLRRHFHEQLEQVWTQTQYREIADLRRFPDGRDDLGVYEKRDGLTFCPLITERLHLISHIHLLYLRPQQPGKLIYSGGDIDNRLKTLFDALRIPSDDEARQSIDDRENFPQPLYCLLQDDQLITGIEVETDRLLDSRGHDNKGNPISLIILTVTVKATKLTPENMGLVA
ncbi:MAG: hypothetical protein AAF220_14765 [Pseudomonadota bacterium]